MPEIEPGGGTAVAERPRTPEVSPPATAAEATQPIVEKKWPAPPISLVHDELVKAMEDNDLLALQGHTGSGKSLLGPTYFLEALKNNKPDKKVTILVTEPRQLLAEEISRTVASMNNTEHGGDFVGFYHGDGRKMSDNTQIVYTVNASLRNRMQEDLALPAIDGVFLDEIHLRDEYQEAILTGLEEAQKERAKRGLPPLKIVIASATVDQKYVDYFGNGTLMEVQGQKMHHVEERFLDHDVSPEEMPIEMARRMAESMINGTTTGDRLGFLPGKNEINAAIDEFNRTMQEKGLADKYICAGLTGGGGPENKKLTDLLANDDPNREPVAVFSTDVAEAGATFARLTEVYDSGLKRDNVYDHASGIETIQTLPHSMENYIQRRGRLGRVMEGIMTYMGREEELNDRTKHPEKATPAIIKDDLTSFLLSLKSMNIKDPYKTKYMDDPGKHKLDMAVGTLNLLGATNPDGSLTRDGQEMVEIRMDPHSARMLVEAKKLGVEEPAAILAGFMNNEKSVFMLERGETLQEKYGEFIVHGSDFLTLLRVWNAYVDQGANRGRARAWARQKGLNIRVLESVASDKKDLASSALFKDTEVKQENRKIDIEKHKDAIRKSVLAGLSDRIFYRHKEGYRLRNGTNTNGRIDFSSVLYLSEKKPGRFISANIHGTRNGLSATLNQEVTTDEYMTLLPKLTQIDKLNEDITGIKNENAEDEAMTDTAKAESTPKKADTNEQQPTIKAPDKKPEEKKEEVKKEKLIIKIRTQIQNTWNKILEFLHLKAKK
ncbi:MAG TPA: DEAD/DEAH box helicase [Patescibacteria group bacterium]|nr:DEAD/DEAH box helicase [Patescibacteria group bacterium]